MARIKLNLKNLTVTEKVGQSRRVVAAMTNNNNFPTPSPPLTDVTTALEDLENAFALVQSAKSEVANEWWSRTMRQRRLIRS